jgi:hypothetical protein
MAEFVACFGEVTDPAGTTPATTCIEPPRVSRRPYLLRGWGYDKEDVEPVFA